MDGGNEGSGGKRGDGGAEQVLDRGREERGEEAAARQSGRKQQQEEREREGGGYGMLRYKRGGEIGEEMRRGEEAEVSFNYLGQLDQAVEENGWLVGAEESKGESQSGEGEREYLLDVNGRVSGGRLRMS